MAAQPETAVYAPSVYQWELSDPVLGGVGGLANQPLLQLASRTAYLKAQTDAFSADLAGLAPIDSPIFVGTPAAPTRAAGDNSTGLATTAFVHAAATPTVSYSNTNNGVITFPGGLMFQTCSAQVGVGGGVVSTIVQLPAAYPTLMLEASVCFGGSAPPSVAGSISIQPLDSSHVTVTTDFVGAAIGTVGVVITTKGH